MQRKNITMRLKLSMLGIFGVWYHAWILSFFIFYFILLQLFEQIAFLFFPYLLSRSIRVQDKLCTLIEVVKFLGFSISLKSIITFVFARNRCFFTRSLNFRMQRNFTTRVIISIWNRVKQSRLWLLNSENCFNWVPCVTLVNYIFCRDRRHLYVSVCKSGYAFKLLHVRIFFDFKLLLLVLRGSRS